MNCLKCGREIPETQVFCEDCLAEMERYPVKPGTVIQLPKHRDHAPQRKAAKRRTVSPEEQVKILRRRLRNRTFLLLLALALSALLAVPALWYLTEDHYLPGQNYSSFSAETTSATTEAVAPTEG